MALSFSRIDCRAARRRKLDDVLAECRRALAADPNDAGIHTSLGNLLQQLGRLDEAVAAHRRAIAIDPDRAGAHNNLGNVRKELGWLDGAAAADRRAVRHEPDFAEAYSNLGAVLQRQGSLDEAVAAYRRAVALEPDNPSLRFMLDTVTGGRPERAPEAYVSRLFDFCAYGFDRHLVEVLDYQGPQLLRDAVDRRLDGARASWTVLDIGCGTGLCGPLFRDLARRLIGVDLSPRMIDKARERCVYDELHVGELTEFLARRDNWVDLIVAADVMMYVGSLTPVLVNARRALKANGLFAFFVEHADGDDFALAPSGRFVHGTGYVTHQTSAAGFVIENTDQAILRKENGEPVPGDVYLLRCGA